ncbi:MAG TPA: efflux RND transporter periplasmic adaptor subunit [Longimicrobiaceae bacterium]|jgi:HlyD family secretion protein|nr:efflux RND transporter periplasmic adaptor subunit [Longimicrobiaceae bacterium]
MSKIRNTAVAAVLALGAGTGWLYTRADANEAPSYRVTAVEVGSLEQTVSATGTLGAVTTVQVGTQVSGQVSAIYADFNQRVKKGQLLARIDPTLQQQAVQDAQAGVERAQAQLAQAQSEWERNKQLYDRQVITASEFGTIQSNFSVQQANVKSARVALDRARQNLSYTAIYAPIDGIVVERNVDVGQTVAASLSAPQLFLIANDLSQMEILASVDESDIGSIKEGQPVHFTVQSYPNDTFTGAVKQVRLQSKTADNVVSYTAVVSVPNPTGKLLPGMTATVDFQTGSASQVLVVPNAALRFRPATADSAAAKRQGAASAGTGAARTGARTGAGAAGRTGRGKGGTLWMVGTDGKPQALRVKTGLSDGQRTQVEGTGLSAGTKIIVGTNDTQAKAGSTASSNPLAPSSRRTGGAGGPPGGF